MHFLCACVADELDQTSHRGTTHDGVINHDNALALNRAAQGIELQTYRALTLVLTGLNEGTANITILNQTHAVGNARILGIADCSRDTGVRDTDDDIGPRPGAPRTDNVRPPGELRRPKRPSMTESGRAK